MKSFWHLPPNFLLSLYLIRVECKYLSIPAVKELTRTLYLIRVECKSYIGEFLDFAQGRLYI